MTQRPAPRRARVALRTALLALGLTTVGIAATAGVTAAHTPDVRATCSGLHYSFSIYDGGDTNNLLTVTVDGRTVIDQRFGSSLSGDATWDDSIPHTWTVTVDASVDDPGNTQWDFAAAGSEEPCTAPTSTTPTTEAPTTTTEPTSTPTTDTPTTTETPTTTIEPTSTLAAETPTTTTEPATTTVDSSEPPTSAAAIPTVDPSPSTTSAAVPNAAAVLAVEPPTVSADDASTTTANVAPPTGAPLTAPATTTLPETGTNAGSQALLALAVLAAGVGLIVITRRKGASTL